MYLDEKELQDKVYRFFKKSFKEKEPLLLKKSNSIKGAYNVINKNYNEELYRDRLKALDKSDISMDEFKKKVIELSQVSYSIFIGRGLAVIRPDIESAVNTMKRINSRDPSLYEIEEFEGFYIVYD